MRPKERRSQVYHLTILASAVIILVVGALLRAQFNADAIKKDLPIVDALPSEIQAVKTALRKNELESITGLMDQLAKKVGSSVVSITAADETPSAISYKTYSDLIWGGQSPASPGGVVPCVSGLLLDNNGNVITTSRVRDFRQPLRVRLDSSEEKTAEFIASDDARGTALIRIQQPVVLTGFPASTTEMPKTGKWLVRLGRSRSGQLNISLAMISADRTKENEGAGFELQAYGNPDHDGSPAFSPDGKVAGLSRYNPKSRIVSVLPISEALTILNYSSSEYGGTSHSRIGLEVQDLDPNIRQYFGAEEAVLVTDLDSGGTAFKAGLRQLDLIFRLNGVTANSARQLIQALQLTPAGKKIRLEILRNGSKRQIVFEISPPISGNESLERKDFFISGLRFAEVIPRPAADGIKIEKVLAGSAAEKYGLRAGDLVVGVNGRKIKKPSELTSRKMMNDKSGFRLWQIKRGEQDFCIAVSIGEPLP